MKNSHVWRCLLFIVFFLLEIPAILIAMHISSGILVCWNIIGLAAWAVLAYHEFRQVPQ